MVLVLKFVFSVFVCVSVCAMVYMQRLKDNFTSYFSSIMCSKIEVGLPGLFNKCHHPTLSHLSGSFLVLFYLFM